MRTVQDDTEMTHEGISANAIEDAFPLSMLQQGMLFHSAIETNLSVYHNVFLHKVEMPWNELEFRDALHRLIDEHAVLRTIYELDGARPLQVVLKSKAPALRIEDLRHQGADEQQSTIDDRLAAERSIAIDPTRHLWKIFVYLLGNERIQCGISFHHALWDGWSVARFVAELFSVYGAMLKGEVASRGARPPSYSAFVELEQRALNSPGGKAYWAGKLAGARTPWWTEEKKGKSERFDCEIGREQSEQIIALASELDVAEKSVWCAVYLTLISLLDGSEDIVGCVATHGRPEIPDADKMLGMFLNVLPIRAHLHGSRWSELIRAVDHELREQYAYRHHPLVDVQNQTGLSFAASMFGYLNFHVLQQTELGSKTLSTQGFNETNYHMVVSVEKIESLRRHKFRIRADAKLFDSARRAHIRGYVENIVTAITADRNGRIVRGRLLGSSERQLQLRQWGSSGHPDTGDDTLLLAFERIVDTGADTVALVDEEVTVSVKELGERSTRLAHILTRRGVEAGEVIALRLSPGIELVTAVLAALKAGCSYAMIDVRRSVQRQSWMIRNSTARLVIEECAAPGLPLWKDGIRCVAFGELLAEEAAPQAALDRQAHPQSVAALSWGDGADHALSFSHRTLLRCGDDAVGRVLGRLKGLDSISLSLWTALLSGRALDLQELRGSVVGEKTPTQVVLGQPLRNGSTDELYVVKDYELVPIGTEGELWIGGKAIADYVFGEAAVSAVRWLPHPFSRAPGERLFNTGLKARFDSHGTLKLGSRQADPEQQASLKRIEDLLRGDGAVRDVAVEREKSFGGPGKIVAYCAFDGIEGRFRAETLARLRSRPRPCCLPAAIVPVSSVPRLANGRVDFPRLPSPYGTAREESFEWPLGLCEELLAGIWSELLKCGRVSRNANFFELGGYSLVGMRLVARIRENFGVELPLRAVFEYPQLKSQAQLIQRSQPGRALPSIQGVDRSEPLPLSFAQQRLWFLSRMMPPNAVYNIPLALRLRGEVNEGALLRSLSEIVRRHEALRTRFVEVQGQAVQVIDAASEHCVVVEEIESEEALQARYVAERGHCFDLSHEPLYRLRLLRTRFDGQRVLLVTLHHIIADGWSLGVFFKELTQLYRAAVAGEEAALPPLAIQYADYAHWQRQLLQGEVLQRQLEYWSSQLADAPTLELPTDRPRPALQSHRGDNVAFSASVELCEQLQVLSRQHSATLFMTLLAAFSVLLCRRCREEDIAIGTPVANRPHQEVEGLIGFFVNMVVLRCDLSGRPSFEDVLARTRETALQAYAHQDVPFEHLVEVLNPGRSLNRSPLFQVVFAMQNTPSESRTMHGVEMSSLSMDGGEAVAHYDLALNVRESAAGLVGAVEYCRDLFSRDSIENLLAQYIRLLEQIVANAQLPIGEYALLTPWDEGVYRKARDRSSEHRGGLLASDEWASTQIVVTDEDGEHSAQDVLRQADGLAQGLAASGVQAGHCIGLVEGQGRCTLVAWLAIQQLGGIAYFMPTGVSAQRRRFLCDSARIVRVLDASGACEQASDLNVIEQLAGMAGEVCQPHARRPPTGVAVRVHVRHACGRLLAAQWDEAALLRGLLTGMDHLTGTDPELESAADPVWEICGLSRRIVSMLSALARGERWQSKVDRQTSALEAGVAACGGRTLLPSVILEGTHLAPVGTAGELCLAGLHLLQESERWSVEHPLMAGSRVLKTGHGAVLDEEGRCRVVSAADGEVSRWGDRLARQSERRLRGEHEGQRLALVPRHHQWTVFAEPREREDRKESTPLEFGAALAYLKKSSQPQLLPAAWVVREKLPLLSHGAVDRERLSTEIDALAPMLEEPSGVTEELLAGIWSELLKRQPVNRSGNFFQLGGSSLTGLQLVSRIRDVFAVELSLRELFEEQTLHSQASLIEAKRGSSERLPAIVPVDRSEPLPLSFAQQRLWFLSRMMSPNAVYNIPLALRLRGEVNETALLQSLREIVRRHEALRTRFVEVQGQTVQVIDAASEQCVVVEDVHSEEALRARGVIEREYCFALSHEPLYRLRLIRTRFDGQWVLLVTLHHIIADGWSLGVFFKELSQLYRAAVTGEAAGLEPLAIQYADYAHWQREHVTQSVLAQQWQYWERQLADLPPLLQLPTDHPRPAEPSYRGATAGVRLSAVLVEQVQELNRRCGTTLFMSLIAALAALLSRYARQSEVAIGTPVVNRRHRETESLIGFFLNTLVLRFDLAGRVSFQELLGRTRETALQAYAHQDIPFEHLVERLNPERSLSHAPLFQVSCSLVNTPVTAGSFAGLQMEPLKVAGAAGVARYDLTFNFSLLADGSVQGSMEYNTDLFEADTIERLLRHYEGLLEAIVAAPQTALSEVDFLTADERYRQLISWNETARAFPAQSVHGLFEAQAARQPDAIAVVEGGTQLSYGELERRANRVARFLIVQGGVTPERCVGVCVERSVDLVVGLLGILKAGAAYVPLDPALPEARLRQLVDSSGCRVILSERHVLEELTLFSEYTTLPLDGNWHERLLGDYAPTAPPVAVLPQQLAYVVFTSGSTGVPKGALISHENIVSLVATENEVSLEEEAVVGQAASYAFDAFTYELWAPLLNGGRVVMIDKITSLTPSALQQCLHQQRVSTLFITTALFNRISQEAPSALGSLEQVFFGGEAYSAPAIAQVLRAGPPRRLLHVYGPTEATTFATSFALEAERFLQDSQAPIGRPLANTTAYVLNEGHLAALGAVGELCLGGEGLARGYLADASLTAQKFVPHPYARQPGERLYRTGDLVRLRADGALDFIGRVDHQVKIRGFRIELGEIEQALRQHAQVSEVLVLAREDRAGERRLVAYIVPHEESAPELVGALVDHLKGRLPDYALPSAFVLLKSLPLNSNGKIDRARLPAPDESAYARPEYVGPRTGLQEQLVALWQGNLGRDGLIGIEDNYFALGGDSIRSIGLVSAARAQGVQFSIKDLFAHPTIAQLATVVRQVRSEEAAVPELAPFVLLSERERAQVPREYRGHPVADAYPMSLLQQGMWFHSLQDPTSGVYHCVITFAVQAAWEPELFQQALDRVVSRHAMLRMQFYFEAERPVQLVLEHRPAVLTIYDYRDRPPESREELIRAWVVEERATGLSLEELWRVGVLVLGERQIQFGLSFHHALWDGWSDASLTSELFSCYQGLLQGKTLALAVPPPGYHHYIALEQAALTSAEHREYWARTLAEAKLPWWSAHPKQGAKRIHCPISPQMSTAMIGLSAELGVQEKSVWCAVYLALTALLDGGESILGSVVTHGRPELAQAEKTLGLFLNSLPIHLPVRGCTWAEWIVGVDERLQELQQHRHYPLGQIQAQLQLDFSASLFNFVNFHVLSDSSEQSNVQGVGDIGLDETNYAFVVDVHKDDVSAGHLFRVTLDPTVFDADFQARIQQYVTNILEAMTAGSRSRIDRARLLGTDLDKIRGFNATQVSYSPESSIHELIEAQVQRAPQAVAIEHAGELIRYAELDRKADALAQWLCGEGVQIGDRVGICLERSIEMVVGMLGVLKAGGTYVPIDPGYPRARIEYLLGDAAVVRVLSERGVYERLGLTGESDCRWWCLEELVEGAAQSLLPRGLTADQSAYVIYTSGSTGEPKGVVGRHGSVVNRLKWLRERYPEEAGEVFCQKTSIGFVDHVAEIFQALSSGSRLVIVESATVRSAPDLLRKLERGGVTRLTVVPALLQALLSDASEVVCASMRLVISSGEALVLTSGEGFKRRFPHARLLNLYGSTEVGADVSSYEVQPEDSGAVGIGRPIANNRMYVVSGTGELLPRGVVGELFVGGAGLAQGYWGRGGMTAERFVPDPYSEEPGGRLFRTGDRARYRADGELEYLGRADDQVKLRGYRIELGEIESRLGQHPQVQSCVVVAREEESGEKRLVAYYTGKGASHATPGRPCEGRPGPEPSGGMPAQEEAAPSVEELREHLRQQLPDYMVPSAFVRLEQLPLTANGKVDRRGLPAPGAEAYGQVEYEAPQGEIEVGLAQIWQELLKVERVGRGDNFFALGGHSLLAVQVVSRVRQVLGRELSVRAVFEQVTIQQLAAHLGEAARITTQPIEPADRTQALPLSWSQERLWFVDQLEGGSAAYHIPESVRLHGVLDKAALRAALDTILERHEVLRTTFRLEAGQTIQVIGAAVGFALQERDLREAGDVAAAVKQAASEEGSERFDLNAGPLIRGRLLQVGDEEHVLLLTMHHIVSDGWSIGILLRELSRLYGAYREGRSNPLSGLKIQYADYAQWQRRWLHGEVLQGQLEYWKGHLSGAPELLQLPTDRVRPLVQRYRGGNVGFRLGAPLSQQLKEVSQREGTTLFMTLYAGFAVLLSKLSGQQDMVIGTAIANRQRTEVEGLIGFFVNTLALRVRLSERLSVGGLLSQVREATLGAYAHQETPFERVVEALQPQRSLSHSPLFQVMFLLQNAPQGELRMPGLKLSPQGQSREVAQFDLTLSLQEVGDEIVGVMNYSSDLFEEGTIQRWVGYLGRVYQQLVRDAQRELPGISVLDESEREQLLREFNATQVSYPQESLIHELFEAQVQRTPQAVAVEDEHEQLTYAQLNGKANQLAQYLRAQGVGTDELVGICVERSVGMLVGLLGVLKAGAAYVPLDPSYPPQRLQYLLEDAAPRVVITEASLEDRLPGSAAQRVCLDSDWDEIAQQPAHNLAAAEVGVTAQNLAYLIYTSGSTGMPKGVMIEHRNAVNLLHWAGESLEHKAFAHTLASTSLNFDLAVYECFVPLSVGGRVRVRGNALQVERTDELTLINTVPSAMRGLVEQGRVPPGTRVINLAGEALKRPLVESIFARTQVERVCNLYGPSETTTYSTWVTMRREEGFNGTIGRPIANTKIYILDSRGEPIPIGVAGEICIGGAGVARGYWKREESTRERFVRDPFCAAAGGRMYRTGDVGRWLADGTIEYLGRNDHQVKLRGYRIELGEIESRLGQHAQVRTCVVVVREEESGEKRLVAYYTGKGASHATPGRPCEGRPGPEPSGGMPAQEEAAPSVEELREHLRQQLPDYMVPSAFVRLEQLPLTANGKVDRRGLPAPGAEAYGQVEYEAPQGEIEVALAQIWQELLKVERVGRGDNFFALGGHSLLAVQVVSRVRQVLGREIAMRAVFECPHLKFQARLIQRGQEELPLPSIEVVDRQQPLLLSFAQQRLWFLSRMMPPNAVYNMPLALKLRGEVNEAALLRSLSEIVRRHEALRTRFVEVQGHAVQVIDAVSESCRAVEEIHSEEALRARYVAERGHCFDLSHEPLYRLRLLRTHYDGQWVLLVTLHHIIADGWSLGVFFKELTQLYRAAVTGEAVSLQPLAIQYADYAHWQRQLLQGGAVLQRQLEYWRSQLADVPTLELPTDRPRPPLQSYRGDTVAFSSSAELREQLQNLSGKHGATLFMTLLAAFSVLLCRRCREEDITIGTPVANRPHQDVEGLIGFFVNMVALRCDLSGRPSFEEVLARTRETALQAYAHQDVPFEHLVEVLNPGRSLNHSPLFQVVFAMQNTPWEAGTMHTVKMSSLSMDGGEAVAHYDLTLNVREDATGLVGVVEYCSDLFSRESIENLLSQYTGLLEQIAANARLPIDEYAVVTQWDERVYQEASGSQHGGRLLAWDEWTPTQIVVADEDGEHSAQEVLRQADGLAHGLSALGVQAGHCIGIVEGLGRYTLVAWLAIQQLGGIAYFMPAGVGTQRRRFLCDSAGIVRILDATAAGETGSDLKVAEQLAAMGGELWRPHPRRPLTGVAIRVHVRHASGKLLAAQWDEAALLRGLLGGTDPELELAADPVWEICGLSRRIVSMLSALVRAERWESTVDRESPVDLEAPESETRVAPWGGSALLPGVILEGTRLAPVATTGELCLAGLHLLQESERWSVEHPLVAGSRVVRTGHGAVLDKEGRCRVLSAPDGEVSRWGDRLARQSERWLRDEYEGRTLALVPRHHQWTVFAERFEHADRMESNPLEFGAALACLKQTSQPQLLPAAWVVKEKLPLLGTGGVDRERLSAEIDALVPGMEYEVPRGEIEVALAQIWQGVLRVERVGRGDDFFALGGHSLLAVQVVSRVSQVLGRQIAVREVFEHSDLKSQASLIQGSQQGLSLQPIPRVGRSEPLPLSFAQQRLWFLSRMMPPNAVYNIPLALRLRGEVNEAALLRSLNEIVRRHEALRTRFVEVQGQAVQVIDAASDSCVVVEDIHSEEALRARCVAELGHCFDLSEEPLYRFRLLRTRFDGQWALLMTLHHIIADGWSLGVLFKELSQLYPAAPTGMDVVLEPLAIQYADYAHWQRRQLQGALLSFQRDYWREKLHDLPASIPLPYDFERPQEQSTHGATVRIETSQALLARIRDLCIESNATLFMTLLAALGVLLYRRGAGEDIPIGTPVANRTRKETEGQIGFFVNMLVMRCDLGTEPRFRDVLLRTREMALQAYAHQDVPFEYLVEVLKPERSLNVSPLFQVAFAVSQSSPYQSRLDGIEIEPLMSDLTTGSARYELTFDFSETPAGLSGAVEYRSDLFSRETVVNIMSQYVLLLEQIVDDPGQSIDEYELTTSWDRGLQLDWQLGTEDKSEE